MRSTIYRNRTDSPEREPLLPTAIPGPGYSRDRDDNEQPVLVESHGDVSLKLPQYIAALSATLGALAAGTTLGWSSPVVFKISQENSTDYNFPISASECDWVSSLVNLGAAAVCFPIGLIMDAIGRKTTMLLLVLPFTLGWMLITFASNVGMLMVGRFITGIAGGGFCVTVPAYTSEIAEDSIRGTLGSYFQLMVTVGILYAYSVGSFATVFVFNILCTLIPIIFGAIFVFMPETPNFLVLKGKNNEAKATLIRLRGRNYDVDCELNNLIQKAQESKNNPVAFLSAITKKTAIKALIICYALMLFQQISGINAVLFNVSTIFATAHLNIETAAATIIVGFIQVAATFTASLIIDKLGRRILLLTSALLMCLCSSGLGGYFFLQDMHSKNANIVQAISWLPLLSLSLFIVSFSIGFGPIPWMMASELCLMDIKAFVGSSAATFNWLLSFTVTSTFTKLSIAMGSGQIFWMFAGFTMLGFLFTFFVIPETKGKSSDEIQMMLGAEHQIGVE